MDKYTNQSCSKDQYIKENKTLEPHQPTWKLFAIAPTTGTPHHTTPPTTPPFSSISVTVAVNNQPLPRLCFLRPFYYILLSFNRPVTDFPTHPTFRIYICTLFFPQSLRLSRFPHTPFISASRNNNGSNFPNYQSSSSIPLHLIL